MLQQFWRRFSGQAPGVRSLLVLHLQEHQIHLLSARADKLKSGSSVPVSRLVPLQGATVLTALPALLKELPASAVSIVLGPEHYQLLPLDKPNVPAAEMHQALPWLLKDICNLPPEDMQLDYLDMPATAGASAKVNVVVASKGFLQQLCKLLVDAGHQPQQILAEELLSRDLLSPQGPTRLIVQQQPGHEVILQVVRDGQLCFSRHLRGYQQLLKSSSTELQFGLLDNLLLEVQRSMDFIEAQLKLPPVREILLLLAHPQLAELPALFQQAGFNQAKVLTLPDNWPWARQLDLPLHWPAIVALHRLQQPAEVAFEAAS
ncbi:MAG: hypothetical protein ACK4GU_05940 [Alishewanella aestuarii]